MFAGQGHTCLVAQRRLPSRSQGLLGLLPGGRGGRGALLRLLQGKLQVPLGRQQVARILQAAGWADTGRTGPLAVSSTCLQHQGQGEGHAERAAYTIGKQDRPLYGCRHRWRACGAAGSSRQATEWASGGSRAPTSTAAARAFSSVALRSRSAVTRPLAASPSLSASSSAARSCWASAPAAASCKG